MCFVIFCCFFFLQNYGSFFEYDSYGIVGGPVKLIGNGNNSIDLTKNKWSYKVDYKLTFSQEDKLL